MRSGGAFRLRRAGRKRHLRRQGSGGRGRGALQHLLKQNFRKVANVKPPASRADSSEKYVVATGFRGRSDAEVNDLQFRDNPVARRPELTKATLLVKTACLGLGLYAACRVTCIFSTIAGFPAPHGRRAPALPARTERLTLTTSDGQTARCADTGARPDAPDASGLSRQCLERRGDGAVSAPDCTCADVVVYHYRGYAPSTGQPSARGRDP